MNKLKRAIEFLKKEENNKALKKSKSGWDSEKNRWFPHKSLEGGEDTLAYGMKLYPKNFSKKDLKRFYSKGITEKEAEKMMEAYAKDKIKGINKAVGKDIVKELNPNQLAALLSYVHNAGFNPKWQLTKKLKKALNSKGRERDELLKEASSEMDINTSNGKFMQGLEDRRVRERSLFNKAYEDTLNIPEGPIPFSPEIAEKYNPIAGTKKEPRRMSKDDFSRAFSVASKEDLEGIPESNLVMDDKKDEGFFKKIMQDRSPSSYDELSFKEAFEQAMKDKGEGETFSWRDKGEFLLKRAEPKEVTLTDNVLEEESMEFDPKDYTQTNQDRESELERLLKTQASFSEGGRKYQYGGLGLPEGEGQDFVDNMMLEGMAPQNEPENYVEDDSRLDLSGLEAPELDVETDAVTEYNQELDVPEESATLKTPEEAGTYDTIEENLFPEEEPKKQEPLTMESLEQRYQDLMKASKEERNTAAWATAATQIASMLDSMAFRPMGIKPINFQANQASSEAKDLLSLAKLKGLGTDTGMTAYQKASLEERKRSRELEEKKLSSKGKQLGFEEKEKIKADLKQKRDDTKKDREIRETAKEALSSLDSQEQYIDKALDLLKRQGASTGPVDQYISKVTPTGQKIAKALNNIALDKMVKMFSGMSKAIDSDSERRFFESTQPTMSDYESVNIETLTQLKNNIKSLRKKTEAKLQEMKPSDPKKEPSKTPPPVGSIIRHKGKRYRVVNEAGDLEEVK